MILKPASARHLTRFTDSSERRQRYLSDLKEGTILSWVSQSQSKNHFVLIHSIKPASEFDGVDVRQRSPGRRA